MDLGLYLKMEKRNFLGEFVHQQRAPAQTAKSGQVCDSILHATTLRARVGKKLQV